MKIMVTGDRRYANERVVFDALVSYGPGSTLIVGDARGADRVARADIGAGVVVREDLVDGFAGCSHTPGTPLAHADGVSPT